MIEAGGLRSTFVAVPDEAAAVAVAVELADAEAQSIELCGAFGPTWLAEVVEATGGRVPVGQVRYGMEAVAGLAALQAPAPA